MMLYKLVVLGDGGVGKVCTSRNVSFEIIIMWLMTHLHCSSDRIDHPGRLSNSPFSVGSPHGQDWETESEEAVSSEQWETRILGKKVQSLQPNNDSRTLLWTIIFRENDGFIYRSWPMCSALLLIDRARLVSYENKLFVSHHLPTIANRSTLPTNFLW
jgi:hypothetical protein